MPDVVEVTESEPVADIGGAEIKDVEEELEPVRFSITAFVFACITLFLAFYAWLVDCEWNVEQMLILSCVCTSCIPAFIDQHWNLRTVNRKRNNSRR